MLAAGMDVPKDANAIGSNLWSAWKAGRIMKAPNGVYTLLDGSGRTEHDHPIAGDDEVETADFPSSSGLPPNGGAALAVNPVRQVSDSVEGTIG
jgi:hypothetical protein